MKKRGRPKLPNNQTRAVFPIRLSKDERKEVEIAAKRAKTRPAEWARNQLLQASRNHDNP
jgi:hypothetical protein